MQKVGRQQQLISPADGFEEEGHGLMQRVALGQEKEPVELLVLGAIQLQLYHFGAVEAWKIDLGSMVEDFGMRLPFRMAQDPVAVIEVAVELHVADGDKAIKPGIGHRLHCLLKALILNTFN